jgi:hypothetical protein
MAAWPRCWPVSTTLHRRCTEAIAAIVWEPWANGGRRMRVRSWLGEPWLILTFLLTREFWRVRKSIRCRSGMDARIGLSSGVGPGSIQVRTEMDAAAGIAAAQYRIIPRAGATCGCSAMGSTPWYLLSTEWGFWALGGLLADGMVASIHCRRVPEHGRNEPTSRPRQAHAMESPRGARWSLMIACQQARLLFAATAAVAVAHSLDGLIPPTLRRETGTAAYSVLFQWLLGRSGVSSIAPTDNATTPSSPPTHPHLPHDTHDTTGQATRRTPHAVIHEHLPHPGAGWRRVGSGGGPVVHCRRSVHWLSTEERGLQAAENLSANGPEVWCRSIAQHR